MTRDEYIAEIDKRIKINQEFKAVLSRQNIELSRMKSEYQREELDAEYKRGYMDGKAAGMKLVEENEELFKVGDVVFNRNNYRYAVILQLRSDGHSATVAEYHPEREDKILVHTPPLAALLKEEGRHIGIIEELRTQGGES